MIRQFVLFLCYLVLEIKKEEKSESGEAMSVYSCYNVSENRNLIPGCSATLTGTMDEDLLGL